MRMTASQHTNELSATIVTSVSKLTICRRVNDACLYAEDMWFISDLLYFTIESSWASRATSILDTGVVTQYFLHWCIFVTLKIIIDELIYGENQRPDILPPTLWMCTTMELRMLYFRPTWLRTTRHTCMVFCWHTVSLYVLVWDLSRLSKII